MHLHAADGVPGKLAAYRPFDLVLDDIRVGM
jgi:hypothetical protein